MKTYYVYILTSRSGVLYIGITNDLERRMLEHKTGVVEGFTKQYRVNRFVHYETITNPDEATAREKQLKNWRREKKVWLIERENPKWEDLSDQADFLAARGPSTSLRSARDDNRASTTQPVIPSEAIRSIAQSRDLGS
jgi:putative endonuclease